MVRICFLSIACRTAGGIVTGVKHAIVIDIESLCDKDVVDAPQFPAYRAIVVRIEAGTCTVGDELLLGTYITVVEEPRVVEQLVCVSCLHCIVVARYDNGSCSAGNLLNLLFYEVVGLLAVCLIKVQVGVEVIDNRTSWLVKELAPRADTIVCGGAAFAWKAFRGFVGRVAQPEVTIVEEHHAFLAIKDGGILAACTTIIASYTNVCITFQPICHVGHLCINCFLHTKQVGLLEVNKVDEVGTPGIPTVAGICVTGVFVTDVVGTHREFLCMCRTDN